MAIVINGSGTVTGISVGGLPDVIVDSGTLATDAVTIAKLAATGTASSSTFLRGDNAWAAAGGGKIAQIVNVQDSAHATGTTTLPWDDSIPQITEGTEFMTLAITPTSATNRLEIEINAVCSVTSASPVKTVALFVGTTANALSSWFVHRDSVANYSFSAFSGNYNMVAGVTTALTFRVRIGGNTSSTTGFNGDGGSRYYGGVSGSSITITEYEV